MQQQSRMSSMQGKFLGCLVISAALALGACQNREEIGESQNGVVGDLLKPRIVDPTSLMLDDVRTAKNGVFCGRANIKNRSGAYVGWSRFVVSADRREIAFDDVANPAVKDAVQDVGNSKAYNNLYQNNCELTEQRAERLSKEAVLHGLQIKAEEKVALAKKATGMMQWASGKWITEGNTQLCDVPVGEILKSDGTFDFEGSLAGTGGTWTIDAEGNVIEKSSRWGTSRSVMKKISEGRALITREGRTQRFERCY